MAIIHATTMSPSKLDLLTAWLHTQPWYIDSGREPRLTKVGGFRLDDPAGEVGIEFMAVTDRAGERPTTYQVPLTYRAGALAGTGGSTTEPAILFWSLNWSPSSKVTLRRKHKVSATHRTPR